jgi:hypothetical protein
MNKPPVISPLSLAKCATWRGPKRSWKTRAWPCAWPILGSPYRKRLRLAAEELDQRRQQSRARRVAQGAGRGRPRWAGAIAAARVNSFTKILAGTSGGIGGAFGWRRCRSNCPFPPPSCCVPSRTWRAARDTICQTSKPSWPAWKCSRSAAKEESAGGGPKRLLGHARGHEPGLKSEAASYLRAKGVVRETPRPSRDSSGRSPRAFGVVVSEEAAAKALPVLGAAGGGSSTSCSFPIFRTWRAGISLSNDWKPCTARNAFALRMSS